MVGKGVQIFKMDVVDKENQLEALKTDVWTKLPQLNLQELEQICTALDLTIEPTKQGKKSAVYSIVTRHLMSDDVEGMDIDTSLEMFGNVQGALDGVVALRSIKEEVTTVEVVAGGGGDGSWLVLTSRPLVVGDWSSGVQHGAHGS